MPKLDRTLAPAFQKIGRTNLFKPDLVKLKNEIPLFVFNLQEAELLKFEMVFELDHWDISKPLAISASAKLMDDGTLHKNSAQIASEIDYYGSYYQISVGADLISLELFTLRKYLSKTLPILLEILTEAIFPEDEIHTYKVNNIQRIQVEDEKVQKLGMKLFNESVFGANTRYGYSEKIEDYHSILQNDLIEAYKNCFYARNCTLLVSGKVNKTEVAIIEDIFGQSYWGKATKTSPDSFQYPVIPSAKVFKEMAGANQSAIRLGKIMVKKNHPDFPSLQLLNTVLGGYFGSRLMSNIREDKGYTYGIGSGISSLRGAGYFFISTEVNAASTADTLKEIDKEIQILKKELIPLSELDLVKNFIRGSFLGSLENAFSYADKFKSVYFYGLDYTYYDQLFDVIDETDSNRLLMLANQYLDSKTFHTIVVGKE